VTEITGRNSEYKQRERWLKLLHAGYMFHQQEVKETENPIIGAECSDINLFHRALSVAIQDAIELIQELEVHGFFDDDTLSTPGMAG
jgi:3-deoxy-D-manno-octulosonate 8-phosphate phosphatase KdsC-like HAD superfamily phosphatase